MKITLTLDLDDSDVRLICKTSLERVLNNALRVAEESESERASIAQDDIPLLKPLASRLWNEARNGIFLELLKKESV